MPWLAPFTDDKKLRKLIIYIESEINKDKTSFFKSLGKNLNYAGINVNDAITDDWRTISKHEYNYYDEVLFLKIKKILWKEAKVRFYVMLAINCGFAHLYWLKDAVEREDDNRLIGFKVMRSLKDIGQFIIDGRSNTAKSKSSEYIFDGVNMILSFVWLKILSLYHPHIFMDGLPLMKEEVIYNIICRNKRSENMNILREAILLALNLLEEKAEQHTISNEETAVSDISEMKMPDIIELSKGISSDISSLKSDIKKIETCKDKKPEYIKPKEAALFLNISKTTLNSWRKKGRMKEFRLMGNRYEYNKRELEKLKTQTNENRKNNFRE